MSDPRYGGFGKWQGTGASVQVQVDVVPPHSGVEVDVDMVDRRARFRGVTGEEERRRSLWSGWFSVDEQPIFLAWGAFDWGDGDA